MEQAGQAVKLVAAVPVVRSLLPQVQLRWVRQPLLRQMVVQAEWEVFQMVRGAAVAEGALHFT